MAEPLPEAMAERAACLLVMQVCRDRLQALGNQRLDETVALEARRLSASIEWIEQGLHRSEENDDGA